MADRGPFPPPAPLPPCSHSCIPLSPAPAPHKASDVSDAASQGGFCMLGPASSSHAEAGQEATSFGRGPTRLLRPLFNSGRGEHEGALDRHRCSLHRPCCVVPESEITWPLIPKHCKPDQIKFGATRRHSHGSHHRSHAGQMPPGSRESFFESCGARHAIGSALRTGNSAVFCRVPVLE